MQRGGNQPGPLMPPHLSFRQGKNVTGLNWTVCHQRTTPQTCEAPGRFHQEGEIRNLQSSKKKNKVGFSLQGSLDKIQVCLRGWSVARFSETLSVPSSTG